MGELISRPLPSEELLMLQLSLKFADLKFKRSLTRYGPISQPGAEEQISELKKKCMPANVEYREDRSRVKLQDLLDHTTERLLLTFPENEILEMESELALTTKWGIADTENPFRNRRVTFLEHFADYGLFLTAAAPVKLVDSSGKTHFECKKKQLLTYLRPVKLEFQELSQEWMDYEREEILKEIVELKPTEVEMHGKNFVIKHEVVLCGGKMKTTRGNSSRPQRRQVARKGRLPVDELCWEAYCIGEELLMDFLEPDMEGRMGVANREAFSTLMAASDPYWNWRMIAMGQSQ